MQDPKPARVVIVETFHERSLAWYDGYVVVITEANEVYTFLNGAANEIKEVEVGDTGQVIFRYVDSLMRELPFFIPDKRTGWQSTFFQTLVRWPTTLLGSKRPREDGT